MHLKTEQEIIVETPDAVGILSKITGTVCESRVSIKAICGYEVDGTAHVRLITENNQLAADALKRAGFKVAQHVVLIGETSPHVARPKLEGIGSDYEIEDNYWCATTCNGEHSLIVFSPTENMPSQTLNR